MNTIPPLIALLSLSALISLFLTPYVGILWHLLRLSDLSPVRCHLYPERIPRIGGVAVVIAFALSLFATGLLLPELGEFICTHFWTVLIGSMIISITGLVDDLYSLDFKRKFFMQAVAAAIVVYGGSYRITFLHLPFMSQPIVLHEWLSVGLSLIWIIGICNAINLIDGLDGLAGGVSIIALFVMLFSSLINANSSTALIYAALLGAIFGFLRYNFYPASIFMGDTGALFIGFMFACLSLSPEQATLPVFTAVPILAMTFPILDTLLAPMRRLLTGKHPFKADKLHLHHRLMATFNLSQRETTLLIYLFSLIFGIAALALHFSQSAALWLTIIVTLVLCVVCFLILFYGKRWSPELENRDEQYASHSRY